jgi:gluconokinase
MTRGREAAVLALDLGTSSVRALVTDAEGRALDGVVARRPTGLEVDDSGRAELDADAVVEAVAACIDELHAAGHLDGVELVATSCFWHSVMGTDRAGAPVTPMLTWADARATAVAARLRARTDPAALQARTGCWPHALYWTAKLPFLAGLSEHAGTSPAAWAGMAEHLGRRLLDDPSMAVSMASGTGLLDLGAGAWDPEALGLAGVEAGALPEIAPAGWRGRLGPDGRRRWPALAGAAWAPALGDGAAANLGAGCTTSDKAAVTIGTSAAIRVAGGRIDAPLDRRLWRYLIDHRRPLTGMAMSAGGNLFEWARATLALPSGDELEAALAAVAPGAGATALPYQAGSRPPLDLPGGSGVLAGLSLATSPVELLAGLLESVCLGLADGDDALAAGRGGQARPRVLASGGALLASGWWRQRLADALGRPLALLDAHELSAEGAAVAALGSDLERAPVATVEPDPSATEAMAAARSRRDDLAARLGWDAGS